MATCWGEAIISGYIYMGFQRKHVSIKMLSSIVNSNEKQPDIVEKNTLLISHTSTIIDNNTQHTGNL